MLGSSLHGFDASVSTGPDNNTQPLLATLNNPGVIHKPDSQATKYGNFSINLLENKVMGKKIQW